MPGRYMDEDSQRDFIRTQNPRLVDAEARISFLQRDLEVQRNTTQAELFSIGVRLDRLEATLSYLHTRVDQALLHCDKMPEAFAEELLQINDAIYLIQKEMRGNQ